MMLQRNEGDEMTNEQLQAGLAYNTLAMNVFKTEADKLEVGFDLLRDVFEAGIQDEGLKAKVEAYINSMLSQ